MPKLLCANRHCSAYSWKSLVKSVCAVNIPLYRSERSTILPRSEGKKNAQDGLFLLLCNSPAAPGHSRSRSLSLCHPELCRSAPSRWPHAAGLCALSCARLPSQQDPKKAESHKFHCSTQISSQCIHHSIHSRYTLCLRGRHLFQIQIKLCFFTENPQIFFTSLKDLRVEQQLLEMKQKDAPASQFWLTDTLPSLKGWEMVTRPLLCVPILRQLPCSSSIAHASSAAAEPVRAHAGTSRSLRGLSLHVICCRPAVPAEEPSYHAPNTHPRPG